MSFLEQFLKESSFRGSIESEEGDVEDNSSKSNISELSTVRTVSNKYLHFLSLFSRRTFSLILNKTS